MEDTYKTITEPSEGIYTEKHVLEVHCYRPPVRTHEEIKAHLEVYQKSITMHFPLLCLYVGS